MGFASAAANGVLAEYAQRLVDEKLKPGGRPMGNRDDYLLPVGPEVGWFLHSLILAQRPARVLELGTSYGYSTLFLADAAKQVGAKVITMDVADYKQAYAREKMEKAGVADVIEFRVGDAVEMVKADTGLFDLALMDIWKEAYVPCLQALYPKLSDEGIIAADNMVEPAAARDAVRLYRAAVKALPDMQTTLLPIGSGIELSVRWKAGNAKL
jgi:predicted O-methyltransferase YrrM